MGVVEGWEDGEWEGEGWDWGCLHCCRVDSASLLGCFSAYYGLGCVSVCMSVCLCVLVDNMHFFGALDQNRGPISQYRYVLWGRGRVGWGVARPRGMIHSVPCPVTQHWSGTCISPDSPHGPELC